MRLVRFAPTLLALATGLLPVLPAAPAQARTRQAACLNAGTPGLPDIKPRIAPVPNSTPGKVLPGAALASQMPRRHRNVNRNPLIAHYPSGRLWDWPLSWRNLTGIPTSSLVYAANADAAFNADGARYRIAFNQGFYGVTPTNIGDFNGDGIPDLAIPDHHGFVDGKFETGEVDIYYGRRGHTIDPRHDVPDVIFYGDEYGDEFGIAIAGAGDVDGSGHDALLIASAFRTVRTASGGYISLAGKVYLIYGGYLNRFRCPVKVRAGDIGTKIPGIVFNGGRDGGLYLGYANELDSGDFSGNGLSDIVIGSYDPFRLLHPIFPARAYVIYGSRHLPRRMVGYRLGVDTNRDGIRSTVYTLPNADLTLSSLGFSASFVGDLTGNGHDDLAFAAAGAGRGEAYVFFRPPPVSQTKVPIQSAPLTVYADTLINPPITFDGLEGIRPNGDVYGDGHQDALLTARYTSAEINGQGIAVGAVGILRGRRHFPARIGFSQLDTIIYGTEPGAIGQPAMASGADFDGDGCTDILINDPYYIENIGGVPEYRGRMWLVRGRPDLPHLIPLQANADRTILADNRFPGLFGFNWATGDFNADGRPDLVIADHYAGDLERHMFAGRTYLFYNHSLHLPWRRGKGCA